MNDPARFYELSRGAQRLLVVDLGVLGDAVHTVPALWELRQNYPSAELHIVCSPVGAEIYKLAGCATRLWPLDQSPARRRFSDQWQTLHSLRKLRFEVCLTFGDSDRNVILAGLSGARWRLGQRRDRWHFWSNWCLPCWIKLPTDDLPAFERRREILRRAGLAIGPARYDFKIPADATNWALKNVPSGAIHFSLSASTHREWPLPHWIELGRILTRKNPGRAIVSAAGENPRERERLKMFSAGMASESVRTFPGLSIAQLAALLQRCHLHIGADSGALQLASALGVRTVSLFRDYPGSKAWMPPGTSHRQLILPCPCATQKTPACLSQDTASCLASITPQAVAKSIIP